MTEFKECAKVDCTNAKEWNINEYHKAQGIERLSICLCNACIKKFEDIENPVPSLHFTPYINLDVATKKGR
jgi:hypothetical protein